jgi:hypothetical protein
MNLPLIVVGDSTFPGAHTFSTHVVAAFRGPVTQGGHPFHPKCAARDNQLGTMVWRRSHAGDEHTWRPRLGYAVQTRISAPNHIKAARGGGDLGKVRRSGLCELRLRTLLSNLPRPALANLGT